MTKIKESKICKILRKHGFNGNLVGVAYIEKLSLISIQFQNVATHPPGYGIDHFALDLRSARSLRWIKEFCTSCIVGFDPAALSTEDAVVSKRREMYIFLRNICIKHKALRFRQGVVQQDEQ